MVSQKVMNEIEKNEKKNENHETTTKMNIKKSLI